MTSYKQTNISRRRSFPSRACVAVGATLVFATLALGGCSDTSRVGQIDEPGEYKGATGPLAINIGSPLDQRLASRLKMVQTDR